MKTLALLVLSILSVSCVGLISEGPLVYNPSSAQAINAAALTGMAGFLKSKSCQNCHGWVNDDAQILARMGRGNPEDSSIYQRVKDGTMPKGGPAFTTAELETTRAFVVALNTATVPTPPVEVTAFASLKEMLFAPKCVTCHKGLADETRIPPQWLTPGDPEKSKLYLAVKNNSMPKWYDQVTAAELSLVHDYISEAGNPEAPVKFQQVLDEVLRPKCLKCHASMGQESGVAWAVVPGEPLESPLYVEMENGSMPKRLPKATEEEVQLLYNYIKDLKAPITQN